MIKVGEHRIFFGDFHGQWNSSREELALLVAGLSWHGYDFTAFQTPDKYDFLTEIITEGEIPVVALPGHECMYEWAHLTTVGIKGERPRMDNPNVEEVLGWFMQNTSWTIMAHPYEFMIDKLESLLDKKLLHAVELVNGHKNSDRNLNLIDWYYEGLRKGKKIPIVSGLDIHIPHGSRRPSILYSQSYPPQEDIGLFGTNRTGVISEGASTQEIKKAIEKCQTFIEIEDEKLLIGPPETVKYLEDNGYWEKAKADLDSRRSLGPQKDTMIVGGRKCRLDYKNGFDELSMNGKKQETSVLNIPLKFSRNTHYINLVAKKDGQKLASALKVYHPLTTEIKGMLENGKCLTELFLSNNLNRPLEDVCVEIKCGDIEKMEKISKIDANHGEILRTEWDIAHPLRPSKFEIIISAGDIEKQIEKYLVFAECKYLENIGEPDAWEDIQAIEMTGRFQEQIDEAFTAEWNGDADLSAKIKMAWNEKALYFKMNIVDDVLVPSKTNLLMFGDCFQIGLNPLSTEAVGNQSFYDIMMTRGTENGNEKAYMERPPQIALEYPIKSRLMLEGLYEGTVDDNGFEGVLTLPRNMISPLSLTPGTDFGLYMTIFDNDGTGLKTSFQWPLCSEKYLNQAWYIPYGGAWAGVRLTK